VVVEEEIVGSRGLVLEDQALAKVVAVKVAQQSNVAVPAAWIQERLCLWARNWVIG
jgi:hypothetical protein